MLLRLSAGLALTSVLLLTALAFQGLIGLSNEGPDWSLLQDSYFHQILQFTLKQALLSAMLSVALAWPVARALYYLPNLIGRRAFLGLCLLCFVMPTLVLITGLVALLGRSGLATPLLDVLTGEQWNLYGLNGILLAHVLLNMPFAVRVFYLQLQAIPDSSWKLAAQLKFTPIQRLKTVEWPALRHTALMLTGFIFTLCFNSFAIVLTLGGGPRSTTLEVAIYQALKYDFNIPEALTLAWAQLLIAGGLFLLISRMGSAVWLSPDNDSKLYRPVAKGSNKRLFQTVYGAAWLFLLLPILALLPGLFEEELSRFDIRELFAPTAISLGLGIFSAVAGIILAYLVLQPVRQAAIKGQRNRRVLFEWLAVHNLVAPAMVISVGLFVFLLPLIDLDSWGMLWVALLNTAVVLPFAVQKIKPRLLQFDSQYHALASSLKLTPWQRIQIEWPFLRSVLASTLALVMVLAMGDVAIFSIFGSPDWTTLPWLIYSYAGTYRIAEASVASLILLALCAVILWGIESLNRPTANETRSATKEREQHAYD